MKSRLHIHIFGIVQGVFFRSNTLDTARRLGITGWVRNVPDGSVEVIAEGEHGALQELLDWCSHGPPSAEVSRLTHKWEENKDEFSAFRIRY
jgi:acylphosphatase